MQDTVTVTEIEKVEIRKDEWVLRFHMNCNHNHVYSVDMNKRNEKEINDFFKKQIYTETLACPVCKIMDININ